MKQLPNSRFVQISYPQLLTISLIKSKIILEELNSIISQQGPLLVQIAKKKGIASLYVCPEDTYNLLKKAVGS